MQKGKRKTRAPESTTDEKSNDSKEKKIRLEENKTDTENKNVSIDYEDESNKINEYIKKLKITNFELIRKKEMRDFKEITMCPQCGQKNQGPYMKGRYSPFKCKDGHVWFTGENKCIIKKEAHLSESRSIGQELFQKIKQEQIKTHVVILEEHIQCLKNLSNGISFVNPSASVFGESEESEESEEFLEFKIPYCTPFESPVKLN